MGILYNLAVGQTTSALTVMIDGEVMSAMNTHPNWDKLVDIVKNQNNDASAAKLKQLMDPGAGLTVFFQKISERVSISNGKLFVDGEELNDGLTENILRYIDEGNDAQPYILFLEKVLTNPNEHSRTQLYDWLSRYDFAINDAGNFLAYKGVYDRKIDANSAVEAFDLAKYPYQSSSSGKAIVDGTPHEGQIPNGVGAIVEMPRGDVQHDPSVGCHTGLHAGTWDYASTFTQGPVLLVEINPRDVVSVPTDCNWAKIRTCRYTVVKVVDKKLDTAYLGEEVDESEEDYDEDYCEECDGPCENW